MPVKSKISAPLNTYGIRERYTTQLEYDSAAFGAKLPTERILMRRSDLFKRVADGYLPKHFEWHSWTNKLIDALCYRPVVCFAGCASAAKTYNVVSFAALWWMCSPTESSVTLVSTSKGSLRQRGWAEIQRVYSELGIEKIGNFIDSQMTWQVERGDSKHAVKCKAVEEGPIQKVADDIKGIHTHRQMVIVDEATSVPKAIYEACENLHGYPREFILVLMANPPASKLNQFSQYCEPKNGWQSVDIDCDEWEGKPIASLSNLTPYVVRFDAEKSPNITEGKRVSIHLPTREKVQAAREAGGGQTPSYWSNFRGFWPPEGLAKTVFSASLLDLGDAYGSFVFDGDKFFIIGAFDPAFGGGDRPALRFAKLGTNAEGKWGIQSSPAKIIPILATSKNPVHFQLAETVRRECEQCTFDGFKFPCPPENLAIDASGEGGGLCDIMQRIWSPYVIRIEFAGAPSEDPCNLEDNRPAREVYENKSVEMWFRSRDAVNSGQFKGMDKDTAEELCNRQFTDTGKRIRLQSKSRDKSATEKSYKTMFGKSPDLADCFSGDTLVLTDKGSVRIDEIELGDLVVTPFGLTPVEKIHIREVSELTSVSFSNGSKLCGKASHKVFTKEQGWVPLGELSLTSTIESANDLPVWNLLNSCFTRDESTAFKVLVDTIKTTTGLRRRDFYIGLSGVSTMGLFLKACASITKMVIGPIIESRIWRFMNAGSTSQCIFESGGKISRFVKTFSNTLLRIEKKLLNGIIPAMDSNGIQIMPFKPLKREFQGDTSVRCAGWYSGAKNSPTYCSAHSHAGTKSITGALNALTKFAWYAAKNLAANGQTLQQPIVPVTVQRSQLLESKKVFNLTLREHNAYYANGVLVDNCLVMLIEVARRKGFRLAAVGQTIHRTQDWEKEVRKVQDFYETDQFQPEEIGEEEMAEYAY